MDLKDARELAQLFLEAGALKEPYHLADQTANHPRASATLAAAAKKRAHALGQALDAIDRQIFNLVSFWGDK